MSVLRVLRGGAGARGGREVPLAESPRWGCAQVCQDVSGCAGGIAQRVPDTIRLHLHSSAFPRATLGGCSLSSQPPQAPFPWRDGEGTGVLWQGRASPAVPAGCSDPALRSAPMPGSAGTPTPELRPLKRRPVPGEPSPAPGRGQRQPGQGRGRRICVLAGKHYQCSSYGCKLAFPSMQELVDHLKVHYRPTQSLEGKARTPHVPFSRLGGGRAGLSSAGGGRWERGERAADPTAGLNLSLNSSAQAKPSTAPRWAAPRPSPACRTSWST